MKTIIPILAMMFLVGCGNNSMNQPGSTNSASSQPQTGSSNTNNPSTNNDNIVNNSPPAQMTNAPAITNSAGTNLPASTNQ
jgi:hypothetical protein